MNSGPKVSTPSAEDLRKRATFGIVTALDKEFTAVEVMLGDTVSWTAPGTGAGRRYGFAEVPTGNGRPHVVALAMMADVGNNSAAIRATQLQNHCPNVNHIVMCGIAGGIPNPEKSDQSVRLGDVVICNEFGVIQYDFVKEEPDKVEIRNRPRAPSAELIEAVKFLRAGALKGKRPWEAYLSRGEQIDDGSRPDDGVDAQGNPIVYPPDQKRIKGLPRVFSGPIASANVLLKDPKHRDAIRRKFGVLAVEMESSGVADAAWTSGRSGYLAVRGICDFCDPTKGDVWQGYAAVSAAAYVRALIESIPGDEMPTVETGFPPSGPIRHRAPMEGDVSDLYNELSSRGEAHLASGHMDLSPQLLGDLSLDSRRGLTIAVRPSPQLATRFGVIVDQIKHACASLFGYETSRFHFTVLSLITAVETFRIENVPIDAYKSAIREVVKQFRPFSLSFAGVCATPNSIIAMGFPSDHTLEDLRDALRARLKALSLDRGVDERYRIRGAHIVLARFTQQVDFSRLSAFLREQRVTHLGTMMVEQCQLAVNDYYFSKDKVRVVAEFQFATEPPRHNLPSSPPQFIGRREERDLIVTSLARSATPLILASGFGGIGKSTLAVEAAWRYVALGKTHFEFIVWIDLRHYSTSHSVTVDQILNTIAIVIDPKGDIPPIADPTEKQSKVIQLLAQHRTLLILDNYESVLEDHAQDGEITRFIKSIPLADANGMCVRILVTTRIVSRGLRDLHGRVGVQNVTLAELPEQDSIEFMKSLTTGRSLSLTDEQYRAVWRLTHGLPKYMQVAIDQLSVIPFVEWQKAFETVRDDLSQDRFFGDLFATSWEKVLTQDSKQLLMAMTYFVGDATFEALESTTGLSSERFHNALYDASSAYLERVTDNRYGMHPLTHAVCRTFLRKPENAGFDVSAGRRFIEYFLTLAERADREHEPDVLQQNLRNVVAAVRFANTLKEWVFLTRFRPSLSGFLRTRGYWEEEKMIMELVRLASIELHDLEGLGKCLVDDLAWLYLRLEDLPSAEKYAREGLGHFEKIQGRGGIAQALRQLGKAALLKGDYDDSLDGGNTAQRYFDEAECNYARSLDLRVQLQQEGSDQGERIADMKLDFGRLYWLRGRKYESTVRMNIPVEDGVIEKAVALYERAKAVSQEALETFRDVKSIRGIAKSWGNIGNAEKEHARSLAKSGLPHLALERMRLAREHYTKSLENAELIHRKDEIAHACWGIAETLEFLSDQPENNLRLREELLIEAISRAEEAQQLYASLAGPRDIRVTKDLVARLHAVRLTLTQSADAQ